MSMNKTVYVALLRGINVGGNAKVEMAKLKTVFEDLGLKQVRTYINSGNVVFTSTKKTTELVKIIENGIEKEFGLQVPVVVKSQKEIKTIVEKIPTSWVNDRTQRTDVLFLWPDIDKPNVLMSIDYKPEIEQMLYVPGAVVWNIDRANVTRGSAVKLIGTSIYKKMTARNINTLRKIYLLMSELNNE